MKTITLYTDGACSGNPGPGGWGAILEWEGHEKELSGGEISTTNNRMELTGVIRGLEALKEPCIVELYSDSKYVIDALEKGWAASWQKRGWVKSDKKPALNPDLWQRLLELCQVHQVRCHWVKGHAENPKNNRCDELAVAHRKRYVRPGAEHCGNFRSGQHLHIQAHPGVSGKERGTGGSGALRRSAQILRPDLGIRV